MAIFKAMSLVSSAVYEVASLVWVEVALFLAATLIYVTFVGPVPHNLAGSKSGKKTKSPFKATGGQAAPSSASVPTRDGTVAQEMRHHAALGNHAAVIVAWQGIQAQTEVSSVDLSVVADSMRRLGASLSEIVDELRSGLEKNPSLLPSLAALPAALLRDNNMDLLDGALGLLEEQGSPAEPKMYAGLMTAQLRRRNYEGVAAIAGRVPDDAQTPRMRAMLAAAAAHRGRLDEALEHLRQMPAPAGGDSQSALAPGLAAQILGLAARDQRVSSTTQELQRLHAKLESRHLDDLVAAEARRRGLAAALEMLEAGTALNVPKGPGAYQALAGALAQASNKPAFRALVEDLEAEAKLEPPGVAVGEPLAVALLDACKVLREAQLLLRVADLHRAACAGAPGGKVLAATCAAMAACGQAEAACDFFEREMAPKDVLPDAVLTGCLMRAAASLGRTQLAQRLSDHAASAKCAAPGASGGITGSELQRHATMIRAYAREKDLKGATNVFDKLKASGVPMSPMIYNCYLDACSQCGDMDAAVRHFEEMARLDLLDVVGYNTMLKAYLSRGRSEDARALMKQMSARGLQANKVTYNELLHAKVMAKDRAGIWQVVDEMKAAKVRVNSVTCSILLKSLTGQTPHGDVRRVTGLIDEIEEPIDEVLFSSVIEACIRIQQLELLSDLMRRYRAKGCFANLSAPTYGSMIKAYGQAGDAARVNELWDEMAERGVKPTSITMGCMVEALVVNGQSDRALELIHKELASEERRGQINTVIYSTVLKGFAVVHRIDKVFACYEEMRSHEIPCNTITYNTMLDACAKCCVMDRASGLLTDMRDSCVEPDIITYSTIVKGYCLEGDVDRAFQVLGDMKSDGKFQPDEIMYNSILDGCAKQHRTEEALRVLEEMKGSGVGPSNYTLSILVKLLGHARRLGQAFRMVDELSAQHGFRPNVQVYTCLVQACVLNRKLDKALSLYDTMVADVGCRVDEKFYAVLVRGCLQLHQPWKALEVVRAAYQLPGHGLAAPARREVVGVEARTLDELAAKLQGSGPEEREALAQLTAELLERRGVRVGSGGGKGYGKGGGK
mmetsp:Transcript_32231/g.70235  ORF Transcript_32231/g.70235 Transcript_32231/m.70235 type:complete len:1074 (+) Transcript_32231:106-3327(+)